MFCFIEQYTKRLSHWDNDAPLGLGLSQADIAAVISRPRQSDEIALALASPQGQHTNNVRS